MKILPDKKNYARVDNQTYWWNESNLSLMNRLPFPEKSAYKSPSWQKRDSE